MQLEIKDEELKPIGGGGEINYCKNALFSLFVVIKITHLVC